VRFSHGIFQDEEWLSVISITMAIWMS